MRLSVLLLIALLIPVAYAQNTPVIAIYSPVYPVSSLEASLNAIYVVNVVDNLTQARGADIIIVLAPLNVSYEEVSVLRRTLYSGGLVILASEPRNDSIRKSVNFILGELGLPSLVYNDLIYDFIHNAGSPEYPKVDGYVLYSSSLVDRKSALRKNYTLPSAIAMTNESVRETGKLVRAEGLKVLSGELALIGGSKMFSDIAFNDTHTRFSIDGELIGRIIEDFLRSSNPKKPAMPLIDEYLLYIAIAIALALMLKTIKAGRP